MKPTTVSGLTPGPCNLPASPGIRLIPPVAKSKPICIGFCDIELHLPGSSSLKDKRRVLRRIKDRLAARFNLSIAEIGHQELRQRARIGLVMISNDRAAVEGSFEAVQVEIERIVAGDIIDCTVEFFG